MCPEQGAERRRAAPDRPYGRGPSPVIPAQVGICQCGHLGVGGPRFRGDDKLSRGWRAGRAEARPTVLALVLVSPSPNRGRGGKRSRQATTLNAGP